jgi:hypothetical protein
MPWHYSDIRRGYRRDQEEIASVAALLQPACTKVPVQTPRPEITYPEYRVPEPIAAVLDFE